MTTGSEYCTVHIDPARIPQHTKLQIGAIFLRAFERDCETPEFQECYRQWKQEKSKGCIDPALALSQVDELNRKLRELRRLRRQMLAAADGDEQIKSTETMLEYLDSAQWQTEVMTSTLFSGKRLNLPSFTKCLQKNMGPCLTRANEMYTGVMVQGKTKKVSYKSKTLLHVPKEQWYRVEGTHEAIIDKETFEAVQRGLDLRSKTDGTGERHVLAGLVRCMDCGSSMSRGSNTRPDGRRVFYLRCSQYASSGKKKRCSRHGIRLDGLIDLVSERIRCYVQTYFDPNTLDIKPQRDTRRETLEQERTHLTAQLEKRSTALKSLYLDKISGVITEGQFTELNQSFLEEKDRMEHRLVQIDRELGEQVESCNKEAMLVRARELLKLDPVPRELFTLLVEKIEIGEKNRETGQQEVKITWKF